MPTAKHLFTLGYEGMTIEQFVARVRAAGVQLIVDVRELPLSRKRGFSKIALRDSLSEAAIAYAHMPALGCPKSIRDRHRSDGDWGRYTRGYLRHLGSQGSSVAELAELSRTTSSCLVCFESTFARCHRTYVARAARAHGAPPIVHLSATAAVPDPAPRPAA